MKRVTRTFYWLVGLATIGVLLYVAKVAWYERYVWPPAVEHMQDLPPLDRSDWPIKSIPFRVEVQAVEVATPKGLEKRDIRYFINSLGMDFVRIEPGEFYQERANGHLPRHLNDRRNTAWFRPGRRVRVSHPYYLGAFEVTNRQYEQFASEHVNSRPEYQRGVEGDGHPVEPITWREAQRFARWLSAREGRRYRLPTEAEWELAARAGTDTRLYWGDAFWDRTKANLGGLHSNKETAREDLYKYTSPVGFYPANPWGLYDMVGNSYEWVQDWWHEVDDKDVVDSRGPSSGHYRMGKGGGWTTRPYAIYTGESDGNNPADIRDSRGFRLLAEIE